MKKQTWRLLAAATLAAPMLAACGTRDDNAMTDSAGGTVAMTDSTGMNTAGAMDASIASFAAMVNQSEVEAGRLASTKARSADVKSYAKDMVEQHQQAMTELRDVSGRSGWSLPDSGNMTAPAGSGEMSSTLTQLQQSHQQAMTKLQSATGATFDRAYIDDQVAAHQQALDVLRQHLNSVQNAELRTKMTALQQDIEEHLRRAQEIAQKLGS